MAQSNLIGLRDTLVTQNPTSDIVTNMRWFFVGFKNISTETTYLSSNLNVNGISKIYEAEEEIFGGNNPILDFSLSTVGVYEFRCLGTDEILFDPESILTIFVSSTWKDGTGEDWFALDGSQNVVSWIFFEAT